MHYKSPFIVFIIMLALWILYLISPILKVLFPSLSEFNLNLDVSSLGFATLLVLTSFALILIEKVPHSAILNKLKISGTGIEAAFMELKEAASEAPEEEVPLEVKEDLDKIRGKYKEPTAVFLELAIEIESKLKVLSEKYTKNSWKYTSVRKQVDILVQNEGLDYKVGKMISLFWTMRNKIVHGHMEIKKENLDEVIHIGEIILSRLEESYKKPI